MGERLRETKDIVHYMSNLGNQIDAPKLQPSSGSGETKVLQLTSKSKFRKALNQNDFLLVMFFAPWCGHCKKMKPAFASASMHLADQDITLAQVDATAVKDVAQEQGVSSYPT